MELIPKIEMIGRAWGTFEQYPRQGEDIVLHINGYKIRENKYCHDFFRIEHFNAKTFDARDFTPRIDGVTWNYSWLPTKKLLKEND